ncbi:MAG: WbqC family protein [Dysgonamonadaceae bacterium]|jgi:hypothetical protein|nr:WbqC family protein [Dysgonamonadaceae bacterium]
MNDTAWLSTAYLAPVDYYMCLAEFNQIVIEQHCNYVKQTYRNRCTIASANGPQALSVPVERTGSAKCPTKDVRISDHGNWRHLHWNAIVSAYNSTPFFEYYEDDFRPFYERNYGFLFDFNEALRELTCRLIDIAPKVYSTSSYGIAENNINDPDGDLLNDYRGIISPRKDPLHSVFEPYYQVFDSKFGFQPNLSIIDLLFNMGPESVLFLKNTQSTILSE